jgi:acetylcholinesterase
MSEDCLTLNVFRPSDVKFNSIFPVVVWIYGGGFTCKLSGRCPMVESVVEAHKSAGSSSMYDGAPFVERSVTRVCTSSE